MSETLTPVFRLEYFITAAANGTPCDLEPIFNEEKYLHAIAGASVDLPMPIGRTQEYLAKLAGMDVEIPDKPIYRTEYYLAHMIDSTIECPAPIYREEMFYYEWASNEYVTISGNPVSFTARNAPLRQLKVAFSPVQSLNGYDAPWPAGGGKNKLRNPATSQTIRGVTFTVNADGTVSLSGTATANAFFYLWGTDSNYVDIGVPAGDYILTGGTPTAQIVLARTGKSSVYNAESPVNVTMESTDTCRMMILAVSGVNHNGVVIKPMMRLSSVSDGTFAPYSNLCPISGWDSLNVEQRGKNLLHGTEYVSSCYNAAVGTNIAQSETQHASYTQTGNTISVDVKSGFYGPIFATDVLPAGKYHVHMVNGNTDSSCRSSVFVVDSNFVVVTTVLNWWGNGTLDRTITLTEPNRIAISLSANGTMTIDFTDVQVELGESYTEWKPYNPSSRSISINIGSTVYSGWVDVISGVGEITGIGVIMPPAAINASWYSADMAAGRTSIGFYHGRQGWSGMGIPIPTGNFTGQFSYCKVGSVYGSNTPWVSEFLFISGEFNRWEIRIPLSALADTSSADKAMQSAMEYLTENPLQAYYKIDPIPIQLTPQEVESLAGDNTMWTDGDSLTVEYRSN